MNNEEDVFSLRLGKDLIEYPKSKVEADPELKKQLAMLVKEKEANEIKYFCPHGEKKHGFDCGFNLVSMAEWISDWAYTAYMNCSPNQVGKTCHGVIKALLYILPTLKSWPIFAENGVVWHPWGGKKTLVALGYDKGQLINTVWPEYQRWIPDDELGEYKDFSHGGTRSPSWDRTPVVNLKCGSRLVFLTCEQKASSAAGMKADIVHADEQQPLTFFNELDERGRTREGVRWIFPFTPHKVDGRPDTGTAGWLFDMWKGKNTRGHSMMRSRISVEEVPDYIYSKEQKAAAYEKWVLQPKRSGDEEAKREGEARYYGLFQRASGLYYNEIQPAIHFVDWTYDDIKGKNWSHYRSIDYGYVNATSCGLWAISPSGDHFRYGEYYVKGKDAVDHARDIIEKCGNERKKVGEIKENNGIIFPRYEEVFKKQAYIKTVLDWHCFKQKGGTGRPISFFFHINGLRVTPSTQLQQEERAMNLRALLKIDPNRRHMVTGVLGAPRLYISRPKCPDWINEWEHCVFDTRRDGNMSHNAKEGKRDKDDHAIDETEYAACANFKFDPYWKSDGQVNDYKPIIESGGY